MGTKSWRGCGSVADHAGRSIPVTSALSGLGCLGALALTCLPMRAGADISVSRFGDHMVLQRNMPVTLWGAGAPGERVEAAFNGHAKAAVTDAAGRWEIKLDAMPGSEPADLVLKGANTLTLKDVAVGEVWLCSGQSNMAMGLNHADSSGEAVRTADFPRLRFNKSNASKAWTECSPATAGSLSAVAFYFGRELQAKPGGYIGLLERAVSGTRVEQWLPPETAASDKALSSDTLFAGLYRSEIEPLIPMTMRGAIWYQGESNESTPDTYRTRLPALISGWRKAWGQGDFPFYLVQLPLKDKIQTLPEGDGTWPRIREIQRLMLALPNTGLAVALDAGSPITVHPLNKEPVGYRLSLIARAKVYGESGLAYSGPMYRDMAAGGGEIRLRFSQVGKGLVAKGPFAGTVSPVLPGSGTVKGFSIAGADGKWSFADARIHGDTVTLRSPQVADPVQARYAWSQNPIYGLYNADGLPASPFQTAGEQIPSGLSEPASPRSARGRPARAADITGPRVDASGRLTPSARIRFFFLRP